MNYPVFDLHCDTILTLIDRKGRQQHSLRKNGGHIDLERAQALGGYCQCFACFTTPFMEKWYGCSPQHIFQLELEMLGKALIENTDILRQARTAKEAEENRKNGYVSAVFTLEGTAGIDYNPEKLENLWKQGFRVVSLGWNEQNPLCGSNVTGGGLTDLGREFVREAQRIGMLVDVSHISDEAFWDIMKITEAPVIATHSNSRSVCAETRNLTDDMFRQICATGGVVGFNQYASFVGPYATMELACRHFLHFMEIDPECKHIALGGDLDGCEELPAGFEGIQSYPLFAEKLRQAGLTEDNIGDIYWNNAIGVMERCYI